MSDSLKTRESLSTTKNSDVGSKKAPVDGAFAPLIESFDNIFLWLLTAGAAG